MITNHHHVICVWLYLISTITPLLFNFWGLKNFRYYCLHHRHANIKAYLIKSLLSLPLQFIQPAVLWIRKNLLSLNCVISFHLTCSSTELKSWIFRHSYRSKLWVYGPDLCGSKWRPLQALVKKGMNIQVPL